jgi:hypothetical protein
MPLLSRHQFAIALAVAFAAAPLSAQEKPPAKAAAKDPMAGMDHSKMDHSAMHGAPAAWKEMDAYHMLVMATWHPAKDKNDLAPTRAKAAEMVTSAKTLAASKAPAHCQTPTVLKAQSELPAETAKVAALVTAKVADAELKAALKTLHDKFDVLEQGCAAPAAKK